MVVQRCVLSLLFAVVFVVLALVLNLSAGARIAIVVIAAAMAGTALLALSRQSRQ